MNKNNLPLSSQIQIKNTKNNFTKRLTKEFNKVIFKINSDIKNPKTTLSILDNKYKFNFENKDLKKFKKFKTIALIGMGGSALGSKALYYFLEKKIKKNLYFFDNINEKKLFEFRKKKNFKNVLFVVI